MIIADDACEFFRVLADTIGADRISSQLAIWQVINERILNRKRRAEWESRNQWYRMTRASRDCAGVDDPYAGMNPVLRGPATPETPPKRTDPIKTKCAPNVTALPARKKETK